MHYNRKERRRIAKMLGLHGKRVIEVKKPDGTTTSYKRKESSDERLERVWRASEVGRSIETQFTQETENSVREQMLAKEAKALSGLTAKFGEEKAREIMMSNFANAQKRDSDLQARRERQEARRLEKAAK